MIEMNRNYPDDVRTIEPVFATPPDTDALLRQALEALDKADKISGYPNNKAVRAAIRKHLGIK